MSYSEVEVSDTYSEWTGTYGLKVTARGGTRRQRGAAIGAAVRGKGWTLTSVHYSESYGFQSATYATYRRTV